MVSDEKQPFFSFYSEKWAVQFQKLKRLYIKYIDYFITLK